MIDDRRDESRDRDRELQELVGRTVAGKYTIIRLIGRGGMGAVYEAEHGAVGKRVALKFIDREWAKDEQVASRFAREARAANAIESDHIVSVFDAGTDAGRPYLVMELLRGEDLGARLRRLGRIPVEEALDVVAQVLRGLARAHDAGIVHRDLKPDNVFLTERENDPLFAKIVDFGISKIARPKAGTTPLALTQKGIVLGTPFYMSPEQAQAFADVDGRADLYSVGAILFECLAGRPPHTGETYEQVIVSICMRDAPDLRAIVPSTPDRVADLVTRALARDRAQRYQTAAEMLSAIRAVAPDLRAARPLVKPVMGKTMLSHGVATPMPAGPPTDVSWTAGARVLTQPEPATPAARGLGSRGLLVVTALLATLSGLGITLWLINASAPPRAPAAVAGMGSTKGAAAPTGSGGAAAAMVGTTRGGGAGASSQAAPPATAAAAETPAAAAAAPTDTQGTPAPPPGTDTQTNAAPAAPAPTQAAAANAGATAPPPGAAAPGATTPRAHPASPPPTGAPPSPTTPPAPAPTKTSPLDIQRDLP